MFTAEPANLFDTEFTLSVSGEAVGKMGRKSLSLNGKKYQFKLKGFITARSLLLDGDKVVSSGEYNSLMDRFANIHFKFGGRSFKLEKIPAGMVCKNENQNIIGSMIALGLNRYQIEMPDDIPSEVQAHMFYLGLIKPRTIRFGRLS